MQETETLRMLAEYMEKGFLENIMDMFRHDRGLYAFVPALISDERERVRIGAAALVEALGAEHTEEITALVPRLAPLLGHPTPNIRADAVYLLGIIGDKSAIPFLEAARHEEVEPVRELIEETLEELREQ